MSGALAALPGGASPVAGAQPSPSPGLPPGTQPPRGNVGPVTQPQTNPGNSTAAMLDVRNALQLLQRALPNIPMGSPIHGDILDVVRKLSKHAAEEGPQSMLNQSLLTMIRERAQNPMAQAMGRMFPGQQGGATPPTPPAMPAAAAAA